MFGIIVNPASGGGRSIKLAMRIEQILAERCKGHRIFETHAQGDGAAKVRQALSQGYGHIVCIGGDGTLSEVVRGVCGASATLYVVPCGTGNDFARALHLPTDPVQAFISQLDGMPAFIDCGTVNGMPFINVSGSGFDVDVLVKTEELKTVYPGEKAYHKAVVSAVNRYRAFEAEVSVDGGAFTRERLTIAEVANGQYIGGGLRVAPNAVIDDGLFDVVLVHTVPRFAIALLLPLFKCGVHARLPLARIVRAKRVVIRKKGMVVNVDGSLIPMDEACFEIRPGALRIMCPGMPRARATNDERA